MNNLREIRLKKKQSIPKINVEEDREEPMKRVQRFLSVAELPEEFTKLVQSFTRRQSLIIEESDDEDENLNTSKTKLKLPVVKEPRKDSFKKSNKYSFYEHGYGLSQEEKANIISDIIRNFNVDRFLKEFKDSYVVSYKYKKK